MKENLITQNEIETMERIDRDCLAMHLCPPPKTFIDLCVKDANGIEISGVKMKSNSWVRNAYNLMVQCFGFSISDGGTNFGEGSLSLKNTSNSTYGTGYYPLYPPNPTGIGGGDSSSNRGIVVGKGTAIETMNSYQLSDIIVSGTATGQISYTPATRNVSYDSSTKKWTLTLTRIFNNNSASTITITEIGLIQQILDHNKYYYNDILCSRDKMTSEVNVPSAGQLTVTYTVEMVIPS